MKSITQKFGIKILGIISLLTLLAISVFSGLFSQTNITETNHTDGVSAQAGDAVKSTQVDFSSQKRLRFAANQGQAGQEAKYHVQGAGHTVLFHEDMVVLKRDESEDARNEIVLRFDGANQSPTVSGVDKLSGVAHFYKGQNPDKWHTNVPTYKSVRYSELYPGIDMAYIGDDGALESEFYVAPGIDYHQIKLNYSGMISSSINGEGALVLKTELGDLVEKSPYAYQDIAGERVEVESEYVMLADATVGFQLGTYNDELPLVIDPELVFLNVIDGPFSGGQFATSVVHDASGNLIYAGSGRSVFPTTDTIASSNHLGSSSNDGLLMKVDATTGAVIYSALFGGQKLDYFNDMATDASGSLYLTGLTSSTDLPLLNPAQDSLAGREDAFLTILDSSGVLMYSTYMGGALRDWAQSIALDGSGNIYIGGKTESVDYPTVNGFQMTFQGGTNGSAFPADNFVTKFDALGNVVYSTYLGGSKDDRFSGIAVTSSGELTITGSTTSLDFPLMIPYQDTLGGERWGTGDMFVTRLNVAGDALIYSTYFGGILEDWGSDIVLGPDGTAFIAGGTSSENFQIIGGISAHQADSSDGVLVSFDNTGQPNYSLRTNRSGNDYFRTALLGDDSTVYIMAGWTDTISIFKEVLGVALIEHFDIHAPGHGVNGAHLSGTSLAFATSYFATSANPVSTGSQDHTNFPQSSSQAGHGECEIDGSAVWATIVVQFENAAYFVGGYDFGDGIFKVVRDPFGKVAVNGEATEVDADEVVKLEVEGTPKDDEIDLSEMSPNEFPSIIRNNITTGAGADYIQTVRANIEFFINAGLGPDEIYALLWIQSLEAIFNGGVGNDTYRFAIGDNPPGAAPLLSNPNSSNGKIGVATFVDSSGIDTLIFADYGLAVTLNLDIQKSAQTIDASGTQLILDGIFEVVFGSAHDDEITVAPLAGVARHIDGASGNDILNIAPVGVQSVDDGSTITTPGFANMTYSNIGTVNLPIITDVDDQNSALPFKFSLNQNYPNPFNPKTLITYSIPAKSKVTISIYNVLGQEIQVFSQGSQSAGEHSISWDATDSQGAAVASGMYFYKISAGDFNASRKMVLLK